MRDAMRSNALRAAALILVLVLAIAGCGQQDAAPTPSATPSPAPTETKAAPSPSPSPSLPPLSIELPETESTVVIEYSVTPNIPAEGTGQLLVTVTNTSSELLDEIIVRWPTEVEATIYLAPFEPGPERMVNPLVVPWTRWVEGPGTRGEPEGTTSLGWGPIDPGMTLEIPIIATRRAEGAIEFDLQLLEGSRDTPGAILVTADGDPAETRVTVAP